MPDPQQHDEASIFESARKISDRQARSDYVEKACGSSTVLKSRVQALLAALDSQPDFLDQAPSGVGETIDLSPSVEQLGTVIDRYKIMEQIGEGGFGVVYAAQQSTPVKRKVALKVIKPGMDTKEVIARFEAERQALALMTHPNIAKVFDAGTTESGRPYFVMELVSGLPITEYCDRNQLDTRRRLELFVSVCRALQHAHQKGVIHRDIKPSNVLVTEHDEEPVPKVIDFGVAKAINQQLTEQTIYTRHQVVVGTPLYMSPEQAELSGLDIDTRSDVYSLGVLLYELLTGVTPFDQQMFREAAYDEIRRMICEQEPPKPSTRISTLDGSSSDVAAKRRTDARRLQQIVRGELDWIVMKALEKDRRRRYETASGFSADIQRYLDGDPVQACPPSTLYRLRKFAKRNKVAFATTTLVAAALVLGLAGTTWQMLVALDAKELATASEKEANQEAQRANLERARADAKSEELQEQLLIAKVTRLAAQSESVRRNAPVQSLLLAMEAVKVSRSNDEIALPIAHESLLAATSSIGGIPLPGERAVISPDGHWLATDGSRIELWDLSSDHPDQSPLLLGDASESSGDGQLGAAGIVAFSGDSKWLATGHDSGEIRLWDLTMENPADKPISLREHHKPISSLAFDPNGRWLASGSKDSTARIWDLREKSDRSRDIRLDQHNEAIKLVLISPDGRWLLTRSKNWRLLWDLQSADPTVPSYQQQLDYRYYATDGFSPDSRWLTATADKDARLLPLDTDDPIVAQVLKREIEGPFTELEYSSDSQRLVTTIHAGPVYVWDLAKSSPFDEPTVLSGHHSKVAEADFGEDQRLLVTGSYDDTARVWDLDSEDPSSRPILLRGHEGSIQGVKLFGNDRWVATGSFDGTVRLWDLHSPDPSHSPLILRGHDSRVERISVTPDNRWAYTDGPGPPRLWRINIQDPAGSPVTHRAQLQQAVLSENGRWLFTSHQGKIRVTDLSDRDPSLFSRIFNGHEQRINSLSASSDGRWLASGGEDQTAKLWDLHSEEPLKPAAVFREHSSPVFRVSLSPDGRWLVTIDGEKARLWDLTRADPTSSPIELWASRKLFFKSETPFSSDGKLLALGNDDGEIHVWRFPADEAPSQVAKLDLSGPVAGITFSPDQRWLAACCIDESEGRHSVRLWDLTNRSMSDKPNVFPDPAGTRIFRARFSPDARWLASAGWVRSPTIWDLSAENPLQQPLQLVGHRQSVHSIAFFDRGQRIVTGGEDYDARVWDLNSSDPSTSTLVLRGHSSIVTSVAASEDHGWIVTNCSQDKTVRLWDMNLDSAMDRARRYTGRELTAAERKQFYLDDEADR